MNRLRTRWTAWPIALLMVLSISGVAGASALISFKQPATHVAQTSDQDEDGDDQGETADDQGDDENAEADDADEAPEADEQDVEDQDVEDQESSDSKLPTAADLATCASDTVTAEDLLPKDGESHGKYVSRIAHSVATGPDGNHGFCVSAAARGLFEQVLGTDQTPPTTQPTADEVCNGLLKESLASTMSHGEYVSMVAQSDAIGGDHQNHGYCVSRAARGDFEEESTEAASPDSTTECDTTAAHGKGKSKAKHDDADVEDQDVEDVSAGCTTDDAKSKAEKAKDNAEKKAEKAKKAKAEHGKRRGKGHRP